MNLARHWQLRPACSSALGLWEGCGAHLLLRPIVQAVGWSVGEQHAMISSCHDRPAVRPSVCPSISLPEASLTCHPSCLEQEAGVRSLTEPQSYSQLLEPSPYTQGHTPRRCSHDVMDQEANNCRRDARGVGAQGGFQARSGRACLGGAEGNIWGHSYLLCSSGICGYANVGVCQSLCNDGCDLSLSGDVPPRPKPGTPTEL